MSVIMIKPKRFSLNAQTSIAGLRDSGYGTLGPAIVPRSPVLPTRHASAQLELPLVLPVPVRQRLRTA